MVLASFLFVLVVYLIVTVIGFSFAIPFAHLSLSSS